MRVAVRHQFIGALAGGIQRHGLLDRVVDAERQLGVGAVYRTAGGIDQVAGRLLAAGLEDVEETDQVGLAICAGIVQRITHPGLGRQVDHFTEGLPAEQLLQLGRVGDVEGMEVEAGKAEQLLQARQLQLDAVVGIEVVDADHLDACFAQAPRKVVADEAGHASDQYGHAGCTWPRPMP
ncbi:hypothetical protein D9M71_619480 [compost metagenome]